MITGPCLCGDPYCGSCGDPYQEAIDDALDDLEQEILNNRLTVEEIELLKIIGLQAVELSRKIVDKVVFETNYNHKAELDSMQSFYEEELDTLRERREYI